MFCNNNDILGSVIKIRLSFQQFILKLKGVGVIRDLSNWYLLLVCRPPELSVIVGNLKLRQLMLYSNLLWLWLKKSISFSLPNSRKTPSQLWFGSNNHQTCLSAILFTLAPSKRPREICRSWRLNACACHLEESISSSSDHMASKITKLILNWLVTFLKDKVHAQIDNKQDKRTKLKIMVQIS